MSRQISSSKWKRGLELLGTAARIAGSEMGRAASEKLKGLDAAQLLEVRVRQATQLVQQLGALKGAAMKVGQLLAIEARDYFPDEVVQVLERLQSSAEPMSPEVIRKVLRQELGPRYKELMALSHQPVAAASIGQVHSARLHGRKVAVKVQYPGVDEAMESDIALLEKIIRVGSLFSGKREVDFRGLIDEISSVFAQEIDYLEEARLLTEYRARASELKEIRIPEVMTDFTTRRVLTLEFAEGVNLSEAVRSGALDEEARDFYADLFMRLYSLEFCEWGLVQTDPNLGNFLLEPEQRRLTLLDFGATRRYSPKFRRNYSRLVVAARAEDRKAAFEHCVELGLIDHREGDAARRAITDLVVESMAPFRVPVYDFSDEAYPRRMRECTLALMAALEYSPPPRDLIFLHRKLGGIFQIMRRLEARRALEPYFDVYRKTGEGA